MKFKTLTITILFLALTLSLNAQAAEKERGQDSALSNLISTALTQNPGLLSARARWQMFKERIIPAASLDDPLLSVAFKNYPVDKFRADETPMTGRVIKLSQKFPFPGKLTAKEDAARQLALWYKGVYEDQRLSLSRQVKDTWYNLYFLNKSIEITLKKAALLKDFIKLTETNYEVGRGLQQDVLKAQVEHSRLTDQLLQLNQKRQTSLARLNTLINQAPNHELPVPNALKHRPITMSADELQLQALTRRPLFTAYRALMASYQAKINLARLNYRPDFKAGVAYTFREPVGTASDGTDFAAIEIGMNIPLFRAKRDAALSGAKAGLRLVQRQYEKFKAQTAFEIHDALNDMGKNQRQATLYKTGIIPQANQSFEASMGAYQEGKVSFLTLLDNLMTLYRYEIDYYRAASDTAHDAARLEAVSGVNPL